MFVMKKITIELEDSLYDDFNVLTSSIEKIREKLIIDLIKQEVEKYSEVIKRLKMKEN
ncbi:hypothetical protein HYY69_00045 [Candidatus Woesearchaeota archaeon]|nr:hypothetical protein [Candidatus Woesearchaeota archaeon]